MESEGTRQNLQFLRVVTEEGHIHQDIPCTLTIGQIEQILYGEYKKHYMFYHLGRPLPKKEKVKMEDAEDFIFCIPVREEIKQPKLDVSNEAEVRKYLEHSRVELTEMKDENEGGENDNQIDRLVFHNGMTLKFQYMQDEEDERPKVKQQIIKKFVKEFVQNEDLDNQILSLTEKEARVISKNTAQVLNELFN